MILKSCLAPLSAWSASVNAMLNVVEENFGQIGCEQ